MSISGFVSRLFCIPLLVKTIKLAPNLPDLPFPTRFVASASAFLLPRFCSSLLIEGTRNFAKMPSAAENKNLILKYTKVIPEAYPPTKGSIKAAGYDLKSAVDCTVPARGKALVDTGLKIELPEGCYGRIAPRSGLAVKNFIDVGAGVVDEDYRGVLKVVLFNHSDDEFEVKSGDRIAQLICEKIYYPELEEVQELTDTARGEGGFGSTGTN